MNQKISEITDQAPSNLNTFKEVAQKFDTKQNVIDEQNKLSATFIDGLNDALSGKQNVINASNKLNAEFIQGLPAEVATEDYVDEKIADLVNSAPSTLDTLKELSDALSGDANFASTVMTQIGKKQSIIDQDHKLSAAYIQGLPDNVATQQYVQDTFTTVSNLTTITSSTPFSPNGHYAVTLTGNATFTATALTSGQTAAAELFINPGTYTFTAGTNLILVNALTASKTNYCTLNWHGTTCRMYCVDSW